MLICKYHCSVLNPQKRAVCALAVTFIIKDSATSSAAKSGAMVCWEPAALGEGCQLARLVAPGARWLPRPALLQCDGHARDASKSLSGPSTSILHGKAKQLSGAITQAEVLVLACWNALGKGLRLLDAGATMETYPTGGTFVYQLTFFWAVWKPSVQDLRNGEKDM